MWRLKTLPDSASWRSQNGTTGNETAFDTSEYFCRVDREAPRASRAFLPWTRAGSPRCRLPPAPALPSTKEFSTEELEMIEAGLARARGRVSGSSGRSETGPPRRNQKSKPSVRGKSNSRRRERSPGVISRLCLPKFREFLKIRNGVLPFPCRNLFKISCLSMESGLPYCLVGNRSGHAEDLATPDWGRHGGI